MSCGWISSSVRASPGGHPSMIQPTPLQCDSPNVVTRKWVPKVDIVCLLVVCLGCWCETKGVLGWSYVGMNE